MYIWKVDVRLGNDSGHGFAHFSFVPFLVCHFFEGYVTAQKAGGGGYILRCLKDFGWVY